MNLAEKVQKFVFGRCDNAKKDCHNNVFMVG